MKISILADDTSFHHLSQSNESVAWNRISQFEEFSIDNDSDAIINLQENASNFNYNHFQKAVFINSVIDTLQDKHHNSMVVRINGWNGFLEKDVWEMAGTLHETHKEVLRVLDKKYHLVADEPGFVAPRVLAMIINEAYFAKSESISTEAEIDTALKLGTNYPKGPFEWCNEIGKKKIFNLLEKLHMQDKRYTPSSQLIAEAKAS